MVIAFFTMSSIILTNILNKNTAVLKNDKFKKTLKFLVKNALSITNLEKKGTRSEKLEEIKQKRDRITISFL